MSFLQRIYSFVSIFSPELDEQQKRLFLGGMSRLPFVSIKSLAAASDVSRNTITRGKQELASMEEDSFASKNQEESSDKGDNFAENLKNKVNSDQEQPKTKTGRPSLDITFPHFGKTLFDTIKEFIYEENGQYFVALPSRQIKKLLESVGISVSHASIDNKLAEWELKCKKHTRTNAFFVNCTK